MLKRIFSILCTTAVILFAANSQANAAKVVIVLDAPTGTFTEPEKVYKLVQDSLSKILPSGYDILPPSETEIYVGEGSSMRALEKALKKGLQEIEKDAGQIQAARAE